MRRNSLGAAAASLIGAALAGGNFASLVNAAEGPGLSPQTQRQMQNEATRPGKSEQQRSDMRSLLGSGLGSERTYGRRARPGWSNRQVKRMAMKKRMQQRNRRAHRG